MGRTLAVLAALASIVGALLYTSPATGATEEKSAMSRAYLHSHNVPANGVALEGYCPVAYFAVNKPILGKKEFAADHRGITYYFVSADARDAFNENPSKYVPAYGGWCAFGMAVKDKFPVDPTNFKIVDGKLLLFLRNEGVDALKIWNGKKEKKLLKDAESHWRKVQG